MAESKVNSKLIAGLAALVISAGGGGAYWHDVATKQALTDEYIQAVANDQRTSNAVKVAMVMGSYYESSGRHIGTPYVDKFGRGQPLTVCNGITGPRVKAGYYYTPAACYDLERSYYLASETYAKRVLIFWDSYDAFTQGTFIDFIHNKGMGALRDSTALKLANAGDLVGACKQFPRWNKGTVNGIRKALPALTSRGESNDEICRLWRWEMK